MSSTLYDNDYNQWIEQTAQQLRERKFDRVDWDNLIEEIEDMGKSQRRALESLLTRLLEHLLKSSYWQEEKERSGNHWASEIVRGCPRNRISRRGSQGGEFASLREASSPHDPLACTPRQFSLSNSQAT